MTRSQRILALIPKLGADSDLEKSSSSEDELKLPGRIHGSDSSPAPSIASSLENLHLLSESDNETGETLVSVIDRSQSDMPKTIGVLPISTRPCRNEYSILAPIDSDLPSAQISPQTPVSVTQFNTQTTQDELVQCISAVSANPYSPLAKPMTPSSCPNPSPCNATRSKKNKNTIVKKKVMKQKKIDVKWTTQKFRGNAEIEEKIFSKPPDTKSPLEYFHMFLSNDIIELMVDQTNLYHVQLKGTSLNVTTDEMKDFIAINILMGVVTMPAYTDYWSNFLRFDKIADIMNLKRFQQIRRNLHFVDNLRDDGDRYYKIRPFLERVRLNCLKVEEENHFSIDEMMVPYKGTRAGSRKQYIKNKPRKWGFKIFVRAGMTGFVYDFLVYGGEDTFRYHVFSNEEECMGLAAKVVVALSQTIQQPACKVLYFDNFFTSLELIHHMRNEYGIFSLGTIRSNRLREANEKLPTDKNLKKRGRGSFAQVVSNESKIAIVKWFDNKCVTAASSYVDAHPSHNVLRYNKVTKTRQQVACPNMIRHYNSRMGGVDLADMLIALYRTEMRAHRWYIPLFSQLLDICINNAWLLYRREAKESKPFKLKEFRCAISKSLVTFQRVVTMTPRGSKKCLTPDCQVDIRYDHVGHLPTFTTKGRCKKCIKGQTKFKCSKCNVRLCLTEERNCFYDYHNMY